MPEEWAIYAAAVTLGAAHALEVDHMVAVSAFVGGQPRVGTAALFGLRWGLGHAAVIVLAGGLLAWSGVTVPDSLALWAEGGVGLALVALGVWAWRNARRLHLHAPDRHGGHAHLHLHGSEPDAHEHVHRHSVARHHGHLSTLMGAIHGLAGTAAVVALIPVTLIPGLRGAIGYLLAFGVGTVAAMALYAAVAALAVGRAASSLSVARGVAFATAAASLVVGIWWVVRAAGAAG
jgi:hypothetical protein